MFQANSPPTSHLGIHQGRLGNHKCMKPLYRLNRPQTCCQMEPQPHRQPCRWGLVTVCKKWTLYMNYINTIPEINIFLDGADYSEIKKVDSVKPMREFIASLLSYMPGWMVALYKVRGVLIQLLGLKQGSYPGAEKVNPEDVLFSPGDMGSFFKVKSGEEDRYWIAGATEKHLSGYLVVAVEPLHEGMNRFHMMTIVQYRHWTGRIYFNLIRPFHHVVAWAMMRHAAK